MKVGQYITHILTALALLGCTGNPNLSIAKVRGSFDRDSVIEFSIQPICPYSVGTNKPNPKSEDEGSKRVFYPESLRWVPYSKSNARGSFSSQVQWVDGPKVEIFGFIKTNLFVWGRDSMAIGIVDSLREVHAYCVPVKCQNGVCEMEEVRLPRH